MRLLTAEDVLEELELGDDFDDLDEPRSDDEFSDCDLDDNENDDNNEDNTDLLTSF